MFIEIPCFFTKDGVDFEALGLDVDLNDTHVEPCLINTSNIEQINEGDKEDTTTISFISGDRCLFAINYLQIKKIIDGIYATK